MSAKWCFYDKTMTILSAHHPKMQSN